MHFIWKLNCASLLWFRLAIDLWRPQHIYQCSVFSNTCHVRVATDPQDQILLAAGQMMQFCVVRKATAHRQQNITYICPAPHNKTSIQLYVSHPFRRSFGRHSSHYKAYNYGVLSPSSGLDQCFSTAGSWHHLYRTARDSPGIDN